MNLELISAVDAVEPETRGGLNMNESTFRAFYEQTSQPLLRYLTCITRRSDMAEDLLQEAYSRILTARLPAMDEHQLRSYLFRIASNLTCDRWRRSKEESLPDDSSEMPGPAMHLDRGLMLRQAFDRLTAREKQLLWLAYVEGSDHKEIAENTGLQPGSIRLLLFRARRKLAELIGTKTALPGRNINEI